MWVEAGGGGGEVDEDLKRGIIAWVSYLVFVKKVRSLLVSSCGWLFFERMEVNDKEAWVRTSACIYGEGR